MPNHNREIAKNSVASVVWAAGVDAFIDNPSILKILCTSREADLGLLALQKFHSQSDENGAMLCCIWRDQVRV